MDFAIPEEYQRLKALMNDFYFREVLPIAKSAPRDEYGDMDEKVAARLRKRSVELGFYTIAMPKEVDGGGLPTIGKVVLAEENSRLTALNAPNGGSVGGGGGPNGPTPVWLHCNDEQKESYLMPLMRGEKLTCFALTEPGTGSDAQNISTRAVKKGDNYVINGVKHFISGGHRADFALVFAVTDPVKRARGGVTAFIVEKSSPGFKVARRQQMMGFGTPSELHFEDCVMPAQNILGEEGQGFYLGMGFLNDGRIVMAGGALGTAQACLTMAINYSKQRVTFGQPLAERQAIQWMLADMATELQAARTLTYVSAWKFEQGVDVRAEAAMAKLFATEMVGRAADNCLQIHGGIGYTKDLPIESIYRNVRVLRIGEGSSEMMRILIARRLFKE